jgi:hypothetical protein
MRWPQWNPDQAGTRTVVGVTVAIIIVFALVVIYLPDLQQQRANAGFGPDWNCVPQAKGDPVCIRKPGR